MKLITFSLLLPLALTAQTSQKPQVGTTSATGPHQATINWSNPSCTANAACSIQAYRALCPAGSCPTYTPGSTQWTALNMSSNLSTNAAATGTSWVYTDKDPTLQDSTTYGWLATCTYVGGNTISGASSNYIGTTNNGTPAAPTLASSGNSVN
jgi:hypothetical protein